MVKKPGNLKPAQAELAIRCLKQYLFEEHPDKSIDELLTLFSNTNGEHPLGLFGVTGTQIFKKNFNPRKSNRFYLWRQVEGGDIWMRADYVYPDKSLVLAEVMFLRHITSDIYFQLPYRFFISGYFFENLMDKQ